MIKRALFTGRTDKLFEYLALYKTIDYLFNRNGNFNLNSSIIRMQLRMMAVVGDEYNVFILLGVRLFLCRAGRSCVSKARGVLIIIIEWINFSFIYLKNLKDSRGSQLFCGQLL